MLDGSSNFNGIRLCDGRLIFKLLLLLSFLMSMPILFQVESLNPLMSQAFAVEIVAGDEIVDDVVMEHVIALLMPYVLGLITDDIDCMGHVVALLMPYV